MKLRQPKCEKHGELAIGQMDWVPGLARWIMKEDGTFVEWTGDTEMFWDGQVAELDLAAQLKNEEVPKDRLLVQGACGCEWVSEVEEGD